MTAPSRGVVVGPAAPGVGGLGGAVAEVMLGFEQLGIETTFSGRPAPGPIARAAASRAALSISSTPSRLLEARAIRSAVPDDGWDVAYAIAGCVPVELRSAARVVVVHQASHYPPLYREANVRGTRATGGRGGFSSFELRRRMYEIDRADLVHVTTEAVASEFLAAGFPRNRLVVSPLGIDLRRFASGPRARRPTLAFVGPLSMIKGIDVVADVAHRLGTRGDVEVVGGPVCRWSRRIASSAPLLRRDSVSDVLSRAHLFLLPSRSDAFAFTVLEALASGAVPVVTPEVGTSEIVRRLDERLVVPFDAFSRRSIELLDELDLEDLSRRACELALDYDRTRTSRLTAGAILDAAKRVGGRSL